MTSVAVTVSTGRITTGENDAIFTPSTIRGSSKYGVVLLHGATGHGTWEGQAPWSTRLAFAIASAGIPCIVPGHDNDAWMTDGHMTTITTAMSVLATATGCSGSKAALIGISMGGGASARYAALHPTAVACVNSIIPAVGLISLYRNDCPDALAPATNSNFAASIAPAWGKTPASRTIGITSGSTTITGTFTTADVGAVLQGTGLPNACWIVSRTSTTAVINATATATNASLSATVYPVLPTSSPNADIVGMASSASSVPGRLFYSIYDSYVKPADVTAFATAAGWSAISIDTTGTGHADGTIGQMATYNSGSEFSDVITYLEAHGC